MDKIKIRLIVGLGNPGKEYENTRHNVGFFFIDEFAKELKTDSCVLKKNLNSEILETYFKSTEDSMHFETSASNHKLILAKPQTFMNNSGTAVLALSKFYKIKPENILIVHDDIDILWRNFKFSFGRNSAGHKGVESIIKSFKTKNLWRLRIGIQNSQRERIKADKIILKKFSQIEQNLLKQTVKQSVSELEKSLF